MSKTTIYSLAKELGMTPSMVSRALNPEANVRPEKRALVLEAAKKHGFVPNSFASRLSMKTMRIGIIIRTRSELNTAIMVRAIEDAHFELRDYKIDYDISIVKAHDADLCDIEKNIADYLEYDGLIVAGLSAEKYSAPLKAFYEKNPNLVQVQAVNSGVPCLFSSKHDETAAASLAAEFLSCCLRMSEKKNILLLTGDLGSALHTSAAEAFAGSCERFGMKLAESFDMQDSEQMLARNIDGIFKRHPEGIDGIYITSGLSAPLCAYLEKRSLSPAFVAFDTHKDIAEYISKGIVTAAINQDVYGQMKNAFKGLVLYIVKGERPSDIIFSEIRLALRSNIRQFADETNGRKEN